MRKLYLNTAFSLLLAVGIQAQNVGVDVATPQQKLDVAGALKIGSTTTGVAGSLRWTGTEFQFHDGTSWITLNANTDDQTLDVIQLNGTDLEVSVENDGQATHTVDLSSFLDNTDDQTIDQFNLSGNNLQLSIENDGQTPQLVDLSGFLDNTDDQQLNDFSVSGNILSLNIEDAGGIQTVNLAPYLDNTDNQEITQFNLSGNTLQITLEDDAGGQETVDLSGYLDNTDDQTVTTFSLSGTDLQLQVESDAGGLQTVDLDPLRRLLVDADGDTKVEVEQSADEDHIRFTTAGNEAMFIDNAGNVGIGAVNGATQNQLVIHGTGSDSRAVLGLRGGNAVTTFNGGPQIAFGYDTDDSYQHFIHTRHNSAGGSTNNAIDFYVSDGTQNNTVTSGSTHVMSLNSGNVGIQTTAPAKELEVVGEVRISSLDLNANSVVLANANGDLFSSTSLVGLGVGDNLGDHTATQNVDMADFNINDANTVQTNVLLDPEDGTVQIQDNLSVTGDITVQGQDIRDNSGTLRLSGEDGVRLSMDYNNNDADTRLIAFGKNDEGNDANWVELARIQEDGNVGIGTSVPAQLLHVAGTGRFDALAGSGNRNVIVDNNGDLIMGSSDIGDITGVTAGDGLTGGGTTGTVTVTASANNGLNVDAGADAIQLGGGLVENTTITQGAYAMTYNLNGTGDFNIQDNGTTKFHVNDGGNSFFGGDVYWRDGSTGGTNLMTLVDDGNDGRLRIYENGGVSVDLDANTQFVFNESSLDRNFRIESNNESGMFWVDGGTDRIGIGTTSPAAWVHLYENGLVADDGVTDMLRIEVNRNDHGAVPSGPAILFKDQDGNNATNEARIKMMTVNDSDYGDNDEAAANLVFETTNAGVASDKMIITGRGNVGVGTTNPTQQLHVNGNVRIQGVGSNGSNTRILTVDGNGNVRYRNAGSWSYGGQGDNLGNHTATTTLNMADNHIYDVNDLQVNRIFDGDGSDNIEVHDHLMMRDNMQVRLGNGSDLRMWHNGSHYYFRDYKHGAGNYYFQGEDSGGTNEALMYLYTNGGAGYVRLYQNGGEALETTSTGIQVNNANVIRSQPSGDYGSIQVDGGGKGAYEGYSINGRYVLMNDDDNTIGLYNDINNRWVWLYERNDRLDVYDPDYGANSVAWRFDNNQQVSYRDLNMTDDDIWDANYVECNYMRDGDGGNQIDVYDDFNMTDDDIWDVGRLTVNTIYDTDGTDFVHFDQTRVRIDAGASRDWWFEVYSGHPHLRPGSAGYGFIGRFNNYPGYIYSTREYRTYEYGLSDQRVKKNIQTLDRSNSLAKIMQLEGKKYDLNKETHPFLGIIEDEQQELDTKNNIGFIAQELMQVVPEMVVYDEESGYYMIKNYEQLFPIIVEAMKEQQVQIEKLKQGVGQRKISDFGTAQMDGEFAWIEFDSEFSSLLVNGEIPVVSVTPNELGAEVAVVEKTSKGFKVRKVGTNPLSFDWTAHAKLKSISTYQDYMNPTVDKALVERLNNPQVQHPTRYERHLAEEERLEKERRVEAAEAAAEEERLDAEDAKAGPPAEVEEDPKGMDAGVGGTGLNDEPYPELDKDPELNTSKGEAPSPIKEESGSPRRK